MYISVRYPDWYTLQTHEDAWCQADKFFVSSDTLKMHYVTLPVLRFLCKTFSKLLQLTLQKNSFLWIIF